MMLLPWPKPTPRRRFPSAATWPPSAEDDVDWYPCLELQPVFGVDIAPIRVIRRVARVDQAAAGLEGRLVRITVEYVVGANPQRVHRIDAVAHRQIEELHGTEALEDIAGGVARGVGPRAVVAQLA